MADRMLQFVRLDQRMPEKREADARRADFDEIYEAFSADAAAAQASRCSQCGVPFCSVHCPLGNNIPDWLKLTAEGRLEEAYEVSSATNTFPEICGRICPQDRLCEGNCVIEKDFGAVTIGSVVPVIDRHPEPAPPEHVGRGEPTRPGADDPDALRPLETRLDRQHPALVPGGVGDVLLDRADRDRPMPRLLDDAVALAQPVLRANPAADLGKGVGRLAEVIGLAQPPFGSELQPVRDIVMQRAMGLAVRHPALRAPPRLLRRLLRRELPIDLPEILPPLLGPALHRHVPRDLHELQHPLLAHRLRPLSDIQSVFPRLLNHRGDPGLRAQPSAVPHGPEPIRTFL